ncbi:MAG: hypothetical protein M5U26_11610 [Planctomycetota bacterium]|nr:hypothetical protein [Planctomycetota bacterium]
MAMEQDEVEFLRFSKRLLEFGPRQLPEMDGIYCLMAGSTYLPYPPGKKPKNEVVSGLTREARTDAEMGRMMGYAAAQLKRDINRIWTLYKRSKGFRESYVEAISEFEKVPVQHLESVGEMEFPFLDENEEEDEEKDEEED